METKQEEQDWRMMKLPIGSVAHVDGRRTKSKTGEDGSCQAAEVGHGDEQKKKSKPEKMVATTQLRLALETEEEIRTKMDWI